jgi:hypothetical protein
MYTVTLNSNNENFGYEGFENRFLDICKKHLETERALAFAFILYDFENPQMSKVLNDPDYWLSLNAISGNCLTVFSLHYKPKKMYKELFKKSFGDVNKEMRTIPTFDNPSKDANKLIKKYFGEDIDIKYPSVIFFQVVDNTVSDYRLIQLDESQIENSFLELKKYIKVAVDALIQIEPSNRNNLKEIFDLVDMNVKAERQSIVAKRGIKKLTSIGELASTIVGLKS